MRSGSTDKRRVSSSAIVSGLPQLDERMSSGRREVGGGRETTAHDVVESVSEFDVEKRVDDVVTREAERLHQVR